MLHFDDVSRRKSRRFRGFLDKTVYECENHDPNTLKVI